MIKSRKLLVVGALGALFALAGQAQNPQHAAIEARIKPHGRICLQGAVDCGAAVTARGAARSGAAVYEAACMVCHDSGVAGAPALGDIATWAARIGKGKDALYASSIDGVPGTGMVARGGCADCLDEEIFAAVDFMVTASQ